MPGGALYFSPDGREVAALGCCTSLSTVAAGTRDPGAAVPAAANESRPAIAYSAESRVLGIGTENGQILLWDPRPARHGAFRSR